MVKSCCKILSAFLIFSTVVAAQDSQQIQERQQALTGLKSQIDKLETELKSKDRAEKTNIGDLEKLNKQDMLLNKLISRYKKDETNKQKRIDEINVDIKKIKNQIDNLKEDYSRYIVWLYKYGRKKDYDYLINSASVTQAIVRYKYLEEITDKNKNRLDLLEGSKDDLEKLTSNLATEKDAKNKLLNDKAREQLTLSKKKREKKNLISSLKKDKVNIENEIERKKISEIEIKNMISKLIEEEKRRLAELKTQQLTDKNVVIPERYNYTGLESFKELRGKLDWPINRGEVVRKFGENKNAKLKTVTQNYGIDIKAGTDINVKAVAEGYVSAISWIPGYGSVIIVTHKEEYRTVYGHLTDIKIEEGEKVKRGLVIGKVNDSLEGKLLHFEVWSERNYQNPVRWLARK